MDPPKEDRQGDTRECPVCYDNLSGIERTLSCGHVFCHDCLVKTLISINRDGHIRDTLACPVCRHLTFITQRGGAHKPLLEKKDLDEGQTLEVPLALLVGQQQQQQNSRHVTAVDVPNQRNCIFHLCRCVNPKTHVIFIISAQGRPMKEEDTPDLVLIVHPRRRTRRNWCLCTTEHCLIFLLSLFTVLALITLTLPWILLA